MRESKPLFLPIGAIKLQPPEWLIEGILETKTLCGIVGASYSGKSLIAIDMALSLASGISFHGCEVKAGSVLYIAGEGNRGFMSRVAAWCKGHGGVEVKNLPLFLSQQVVRLHEKLDIDSVASEIERIQNVSLIIIDTLASTFGGYDENKTADMNSFISNCALLRDLGPAVMIVHHTGHSKERARGNSAFYASLDTEMRVKKISKDIELSCTKMKDASQFDSMTFGAIQCELESDNSSVYLEKVEAKKKKAHLTDIEKLALKSLEQGTNSNVPQASINLSDWRNHFYAGHTGDNNDTKKKAFSRVRQSLVSKGILSVHNNIYTLGDSGT